MKVLLAAERYDLLPRPGLQESPAPLDQFCWSHPVLHDASVHSGGTPPDPSLLQPESDSLVSEDEDEEDEEEVSEEELVALRRDGWV